METTFLLHLAETNGKNHYKVLHCQTLLLQKDRKCQYNAADTSELVKLGHSLVDSPRQDLRLTASWFPYGYSQIQ